ncbi:MAG: bestrophin family ion channel [Saprospiraceae bacterium]
MDDYSFVYVFILCLVGCRIIGEEIEDPFGLDCNDLPTGDIAHTIRTNVFEILLDKSSLGKIKEKELYEKVF